MTEPDTVMAADDNKSIASPFTGDRKRFEITVPLQNSFRFVHEPIGTETTTRFVGRANEMESLVERILFSDGGSFLVTGYRGVGKTSFINQVVRRLTDALPWAETFLGKTEIIDVYMNIARPIQPSEIMHHIIRRMYERLVEKNIFRCLAPDLQIAVETAYNRTSMNMARKTSESKEQSIGSNEINLGGFLFKAGVKIPWGRKFSTTKNYETSYLGYDDKSAEHDIISISKRLTRGYSASLPFWRYFKSFFKRDDAEIVRLKIIFVFDELDKLEEYTVQIGDETRPAIEEILGTLKNLFTTSGVTFIFIAGKDLQERWLEDVGRGDSVYESVFSYDKYLPCLWAEADQVCGSLIENFDALSAYQKILVGEFQKYLTYKGRGIPRRIVRTFNEYVKWSEETPIAAFTPQNIRTIRFFAALQEVISQNEKQLFGSQNEEAADTGSDKRRLGVYYIFDWIFRQEKTEFTKNDVLLASRRLSKKIALAEAVAPKLIEKILSILVSAEYIEKLSHTVVFAPVVAPNQSPADAEADGDAYRIAPRRLGEIAGLAADVQIPDVNINRDESARLDLVNTPTQINPFLPSSVKPYESLPGFVGKYSIIRKIGSGGMGTVYEANNLRGQRFAVKLAHDHSNSEMRDRFRREAEVMESLKHPNIVQFQEYGEMNGRVYIVMEYLSGITLEKLLEAQNRLNLTPAIIIARYAADAYKYVHGKGYGRNDIKPSNIMLTDEGRVCVLDFGISKPLSGGLEKTGDFRTMVSGIIGTPLFMAPEIFMDSSTIDARSDIYSFGVVLYKMLTAKFPFDQQTNVFDMMRAKMETKVNAPSTLNRHVPPLLDNIVLRCLCAAPEDRFQTMAEVGEALDDITLTGANLGLIPLIAIARSQIKQAAKAERMPTMAGVGYAFPPAGEQTESIEPVDPMITVPLGTFALAADANAEPDPHLPHLRVVAGNEIGRFFSIEKKLTLGRSHTNDIVLEDVAVSRYHAQIEFDANTQICHIEDLNTQTGTFVNDEPILSRRDLNNQDKIQIGATEMIFNRPTVQVV